MAGRRSTLTNPDSLPGTGTGSGGGGDPLRELFEACKTGDLAKVKALVTPKTVNARDTAGRKSTPLHFAAGESEHRAISAVREIVEHYFRVARDVSRCVLYVRARDARLSKMNDLT